MSVEGVGLGPACGPIEQFDRVDYGNILPTIREAFGQLRHAANIAGGDKARFGFADILDFPLTQTAREFWLQEIIGAC